MSLTLVYYDSKELRTNFNRKIIGSYFIYSKKANSFSLFEKHLANFEFRFCKHLNTVIIYRCDGNIINVNVNLINRSSIN